MKSKCMGKWTITKPTNADGSGGFTTYETTDVEEVRGAGRRGWGISQIIEVDFGDDPTIEDRSLEEAAVVGYSSDAKATKPVVVTDEMVSRFLGWKLPQDFFPDCYIAFDREKASQGSWPVGTNLLHAGQARAMLEHVLASTSAIDAAGASEGQEPVYQLRYDDYWEDVDGETWMAYVRDDDKRVLYTHPSAEIAALRKERDHWKANHDAQVSRARFLIERNDLPLERVRAYEELAALRERIAGMEKDAREILRLATCDAANSVNAPALLKKVAEIVAKEPK